MHLATVKHSLDRLFVCLFIHLKKSNGMTSRVNQEQKRILLDFMSTNHVQIFGKLSNETTNSDKISLWNKIATSLNEVGGKKSVEQWKRVSLKLLKVFY